MYTSSQGLTIAYLSGTGGSGATAVEGHVSVWRRYLISVLGLSPAIPRRSTPLSR